MKMLWVSNTQTNMATRKSYSLIVGFLQQKCKCSINGTQNIEYKQQAEDNIQIGLLNSQMSYPTQNPYQKGGVNIKDL